MTPSPSSKAVSACYYEKNIICPFCGWEDEDSWEYEDDADEIECGKCEEKFSMERHIDITYSTRPLND